MYTNIIDGILTKIAAKQEMSIASKDGELKLQIIGAVKNSELVGIFPVMFTKSGDYFQLLIKTLVDEVIYFIAKSEVCCFIIHQKHITITCSGKLVSWILEVVHDKDYFLESDPQLLLQMAVQEGSLVIVPLVDLQKELGNIQESIRLKQIKSPEELADIIFEDTKFIDINTGEETCLENCIYYSDSQKFVNQLKKTKLEQSIEETIPGRLFIPHIEQRLSKESGDTEDFSPGYWDDEPDDPEDEDSEYYDLTKEAVAELNEKKKLLYQLLEKIDI
ncbi:MAG: hypothetical protein ACD_58C00038G0004 [uncultured bacterium]|nr:MAG: hypothetical protein ACD_58C00038G0004 [uncultured bacterium]